MIYVLYLLILYSLNNQYINAEQNPYIQKNGQELLLCRRCGADVADSNYLISKNSPGAQKIEKKNLFGRQNITVQTLINPFGVKFDIVTAEKARCTNIGPSQGADSWFPGYTWRICTCPHCGQHLGWSFESSHSKAVENNSESMNLFHGLILSNILGENFTDSLIMMPKMYKM
ncbi:protein cereblon-like [Melitaea cinxia]|uniref:protein cereblon-like n=1 Tax=Melitaea cinxia TaxID=113334 RepID=UPI001E274CDB|nr:protein cereblon-like [Melitaea cinxia]XP_045454397.1 protein cereblon-like [Melitaea cinxia]XP_045454402.1 protein cereblon-like [Melitaea cinxia]